MGDPSAGVDDLKDVAASVDLPDDEPPGTGDRPDGPCPHLLDGADRQVEGPDGRVGRSQQCRTAAANAAAAAANDAATRALDLDAFYEDGTISLVASEAGRVATTSVASKQLDHLSIAPPVVSVGADGEVTVHLSAEVASIFARAIPGGPQRTSVSATAVATARTE